MAGDTQLCHDPVIAASTADAGSFDYILAGCKLCIDTRIKATAAVIIEVNQITAQVQAQDAVDVAERRSIWYSPAVSIMSGISRSVPTNRLLMFSHPGSQRAAVVPFQALAGELERAIRLRVHSAHRQHVSLVRSDLVD